MHDREPVYIGEFTRRSWRDQTSTEPSVVRGDLQAYRETPAEPIKFSTALREAKPGILSRGISLGYAEYGPIRAPGHAPFERRVSLRQREVAGQP
jgi:hypothetical protein